MRLILYGAPGSGKGTQAEILSKSYNLQRISLGDILRAEVKRDTVLGNQVKDYMEKGLLVPDKLVSLLIENRLNSRGFVLEGYPRNVAQAVLLEEALKKKNIAYDAFLYLEIDEATIIDRLSKRLVCKQCGHNYHIENMPPRQKDTCDTCAGQLIQRKDDTPPVIEKRWQVFQEESKKLIEFYSSRGKLITIDAKGDKDAVFGLIKSTITR